MSSTASSTRSPRAAVHELNGHGPRRDDCTRAELAVLDGALRTGRVTFWPVAHSWFRLTDPNLSAKERDAYATRFPHLVESFATPRGGIVTAYFCRHIPVAAVLTDIDTAAQHSVGVPVHPRGRAATPPPAAPTTWAGRFAAWRGGRADQRRVRSAASASAIHLEPLLGQPTDWKAKELLFRCMDLHYRALQYLEPRPRKICMRMIFGIVVALLGTLDVPPDGRRTKPFSADLRAVESLEAELEQARRYYDRSAQRQAQLDYLQGMVLGLLLLLGALVALGRVTGHSLLDEPLIAAPLAGGAGAIVSVMTRMTRDQLSLNYESGVVTIRLLGLMRPLLGALFGGAIYLGLAGGLISVAGQPPADKLIYFYTGLAFVAGFSERWAQDVVTGTTKATVPAAVAPASSLPNPTPHVPGAR